jgi:peptidyl-prolyl cis-trans isomerase D
MSRTILLGIVALVAGALTGEFLSKAAAVHRLVGQLFGRGELVALVGHRGVFDRTLIADEVLRLAAAELRIDNGTLERAMFAMRGEFGDERSFAAALRVNGIWRWQLRRMVADELRGAEWIDESIAKETRVSLDEARRYFVQHEADFAQPMRVRPRHIFLAAPQGSESVEAKRAGMQDVIARLQGREDFTALAAEVSEDDASKSRGGDLGFVAADRVPAEFWSAIENLPVNGPVTFLRTHLGFHAVQVLEVRPPRAMTFEEARPEVEQLLAREKRLTAVKRMREELARKALLVSR